MSREVSNLEIKMAMGEAACLELLAEEATELAQAALKMARILRKEVPTPADPAEVYKNLQEEYVDVLLCVNTLDIPYSVTVEKYKRERLIKRLQEAKLLPIQ